MAGNPLETATNPDTAKMVLMAGFFGSIISMRFVDGMNAKQRIFAILSGMGMAHYLSPLIAFLFKETDYLQTIGFLVGLFGMSICAALFRAIENSDLWNMAIRHFTKGDV